MARRPEILVGVDGSELSNAAVAWAVREAADRDYGVLLVHVADAASFGLWTTTRLIRDGLRALAQPIVDEAVVLARGFDPAVQVRGRVVLGNPVRALLTLSAGCALIVVGRQGKGTIVAHLVGSVSRALMARAECPVIAVTTPIGETGPAQITRVVVGLGDRPTSMRSLEFGLAEARLRGVSLRVVHAWSMPVWPAPVGLAEISDPSVQIGAVENQVAKLVAEKLGDDTGVDVSTVVRAGKPVDVFAEFCHESDLLVLGQHRHERHRPTTLGPVIAEIAHHARYALAIVGEPALPT